LQLCAPPHRSNHYPRDFGSNQDTLVGAKALDRKRQLWVNRDRAIKDDNAPLSARPRKPIVRRHAKTG
jgi:hypothetical protein